MRRHYGSQGEDFPVRLINLQRGGFGSGYALFDVSAKL
jgi:hypothetical protein